MELTVTSGNGRMFHLSQNELFEIEDWIKKEVNFPQWLEFKAVIPFFTSGVQGEFPWVLGDMMIRFLHSLAKGGAVSSVHDFHAKENALKLANILGDFSLRPLQIRIT